MKRLFVTGGTGFFGKSILSRIKDRDDYDLTILSRDPAAFRAANPAFAALPFVRWVAGDVRGFDFAAVRGDFDAIIHAATPATTTLADDEMTSIIVEGTERVIAFARDRAIKTILFTSSGAVYGPQTAPVSEDAPCAPTTAYGRGKLAAEKMLLASGLDVRIARCFAFTGPYLNRKIHYAIGNFIQNALDGQAIVIKGDGTPRRSYLYADDLVDWLFAILERGVSGRAYNVGSPEAISIRGLAFAVRDALGASCDVQILGTSTGEPPQVYVPVTTRIERELGVRLATPLAAAIQKSV